MFNDDSGVNHTWESLLVNRHFADFFVGLARKNTNTFGNFSETQKVLVQNYKNIVTDTYYGEVYAFSSAQSSFI